MTGRIETWKIVLVAILVIGGVLRITAAVTSEAVPEESDMATYNELALSRGIPASPPPGYPLFLRAIYGIFGRENYRAAYIAQALISIVTLYLFFLVALKVSGRITALIAVGIAALYPNFIFYNMTILTETLALLFVMLILLALLRQRSDDIGAILTAAALFAGCVIRPVFIFFWPGLLAAVRNKRTFLIATAAVILPVVVFGLLTGVRPNRGGLILYKSYNPKATGVQPYEISETELKSRELPTAVYLREALEFIAHNKWRTVDIIYNKGSMMFARGWDSFVMKDMTGGNKHLANLLTYSWLPVMVLGFIGLIRFRDDRNRLIVLPAASYIIFFILLSIFKTRYRLLVEPVFIIFASITIGHICGLKEYSAKTVPSGGPEGD